MFPHFFLISRCFTLYIITGWHIVFLRQIRVYDHCHSLSFLGGPIWSFILISWSSWMDAFQFSGVKVGDPTLVHSIVKPIQLLIKTNRPTQWSCIIYLHQRHSFPEIFYLISGSLHCKLLITVKINWNLNYTIEIMSWNEPRISKNVRSALLLAQRQAAWAALRYFWFSSVNFMYLALGPPLNVHLLK